MFSRREFLKFMGLLGTTLVAPLKLLKPEPPPGTSTAASNPVSPKSKFELNCFIAGYSYYQGEELEEAGMLHEGDPLQLNREPANPYDWRAVRISTQDGAKLGYIPRERNHRLARLMDEGALAEARISYILTGNEPWLRVRVQVWIAGSSTEQ